ncbi:MAG TPA: ATP-binding protein [Caulobacteraceae bacterium]|jgi:two-component system phosphate regulon sensor histidine kinase PhoR
MPANPLPADPFGAAFEIHPDPALLVSAGDIDDTASRRVLAANRAARDLLRIPAEGAPLVHAMRDPEVLEVVDESLFGGVAGSARWASGGVDERLWRALSTPVGGDDGRLALLVLHDETDARLAERTRADFMANASHELRTPLASLAGFIETLRGHAREDPEARERFLMIMADQTNRMSRLVDDLLSLSRIELNEHVPPSGVVDLAATIVDVADALGPLAKEGGVALRTKLPPPRSAWVSGDRDQIVQVVQNLIDNALKYSPRGGAVVVEVTPGFTPDALAAERMEGAARIPLLTPARTAEHRYVAIRVTDQGPGMDREHLPRLAERFYRVGGQKSGARPGTGLGLAIVKHVVNRHRGGLAVESAPGVGSAFTVYFPVSGDARRREP